MRNFDKFYEELKAERGAKTAEATKELFSIYGDSIYEWLASIWDREIGGFYYSVSARDNDEVLYKEKMIKLLPDIESTAQALGHLEGAGIFDSLKDLPEGMRNKVLNFMRSKQDPDDGYFYHPQWGKDITTSRRARDMHNALGIIRGIGYEPLYKPASVRIEEQMAANSATSESSTVPEHLRSEKAFREYLDAMGINTNSYSAGHRIGAQAAEITAAGLADVAIDFLNSTQKESGLWENELNYQATNGLMKISCAYRSLKRPFPRMKKAFEASLDIALSDAYMYQGITCVYNPPFTILNLMTTMSELGDTAGYDEAKRELYAKAPEILLRTKEKVEKFREPDGAFSYCEGHPAVWSQGVAVCIPNLPESDVNANSLACGSRTRFLRLLDITPPPLYDEKDAKRFFELCGEM